jgi:hypothetical protein
MGVGEGGEMTQALYAHMNNLKKINKSSYGSWLYLILGYVVST